MRPEDGLIGKAQFLDKTYPPRHARLEGDKILWSWGGRSKADAQRPTDPKGMLDAFVRIRSGGDILRFALKYGVLVLCEHDLPVFHNLSGKLSDTIRPTLCPPLVWEKAFWVRPGDRDPLDPTKGTGFREETYWAPLQTWFSYVRLAKSLLSLAAALHQGQRGAAKDWAVALPAFPSLSGGEKVNTPMFAEPVAVDVLSQLLAGKKLSWGNPMQFGWGHYFLSQVVNTWLVFGGVRPVFWWDPPEGDFKEDVSFSLVGSAPSCVFAPLGVQLMLAIARRNAVVVCSGCSSPYLREGRKPQAGRNNYCSSCREKVANRDRQREWRKNNPKGKKKEAKHERLDTA